MLRLHSNGAAAREAENSSTLVPRTHKTRRKFESLLASHPARRVGRSGKNRQISSRIWRGVWCCGTAPEPIGRHDARQPLDAAAKHTVDRIVHPIWGVKDNLDVCLGVQAVGRSSYLVLRRTMHDESACGQPTHPSAPDRRVPTTPRHRRRAGGRRGGARGPAPDGPPPRRPDRQSPRGLGRRRVRGPRVAGARNLA
jgi:hypothetical protein